MSLNNLTLAKEQRKIISTWYSIIEQISKSTGRQYPDPPKSADDIVRFMTCWVTFNFLFDDINKWNYEKLYDKYKSARDEEILRYNGTNDRRFRDLGFFVTQLMNDKYGVEFVEKCDIKIRFTDVHDTNNRTMSERSAIVLYMDSIKDKLIPAHFDDIFSQLNEIKIKPILDCNSKFYTDKERKNGLTREELAKKITDYVNEGSRGIKNAEQTLYLYDELTNEKAEKDKRLMCLMLTIYQIRCNLFHGSKNPDDERDFNLVYEAANVLETIIGYVVATEVRK